MVNRRLNWFLDANDLINQVQCGFRKGMSTTDALVKFETDVHGAISNGEHTVAILFDLSKAYDRTWRYGILEKLHRFGLRGNLPKFVREFMNNRTLIVRVGQTLSDPYPQCEGVPQGSVLSCTLFQVAINDITCSLPVNVRSTLYVDDFTIWASSKMVHTIERKLQLAINHLQDWSLKNGFMFSSDKSTAIHICRRRGCLKSATLHMGNTEIVPREFCKLLGVTIDDSLTWKRHIRNLKQSCIRKMSLLKHLSHKTWGSDSKTLIHLYMSLIKSKLDYGFEAYGTACKSLLASLEPIQNQALRIATGAYRSSPIESLHCIAGMKPLKFQREMKILNFVCRIAVNTKNPLYSSLIISTDPEPDSQNEPTNDFTRRDFFNQTRLLLDAYDIPLSNLFPEETPTGPPWIVPSISVCDELYNLTKNSDPPCVLKSNFLQHFESHNGELAIYCDGSKTQDGTGFGVYARDYQTKQRIQNYHSIYSAELLAILDAVQYSSSYSGLNVTIVSDSRSAISAINNIYPKNPIISEIHNQMFLSQKSFNLCWVPSHCGIDGNEKADSLAKSATLQPNIRMGLTTRCDTKAYIKMQAQRYWCEKWANLSSNKLRRLLPCPRKLPNTNCTNREWERALTRLRIGHCQLTHQHLMSHSEPPECEICLVPLTVQHVLTQCTIYDQYRSLLSPNRQSLKQLLIDGDASFNSRLYAFIRNSGLLAEI